jgi:hypothetical protein
MNHSERFRALMNGEKVDHVPVYYFGLWAETFEQWKKEGMVTDDANSPIIPGMDPDWENGMWDCHGLVSTGAMGDVAPQVIEETDNYLISRTELGEIIQESKLGSTMSHHLKYALEPTKESWEKFKRFLDPKDPRRQLKDREDRIKALTGSGRMLSFIGGSLYGRLRNWMGIENISYLMYDNPELLEEMVSYMADYFMELNGPILKKVKFDLAYFFEDCCGVNGPLFSPAIYKEIYHKHYLRMTEFYKSNGVAFTLMDSDGRVDRFIPLWMDSGFDIIFPLEVGTWGASPVKMRKEFGTKLKMMGGVDKHVIAKGEEAIGKHLQELKQSVDEGGYLPIPDHRIPPQVSYQDMLTYIRIFNEVFN